MEKWQISYIMAGEGIGGGGGEEDTLNQVNPLVRRSCNSISKFLII
jgi:hypothetical protein